jgi:Tol biopolymer transport system component
MKYWFFIILILSGLSTFCSGQSKTTLSRFTDGPGMEYHPQWKPDGSGILYTAGNGNNPIVQLKPVADGEIIDIPTLLTGDKHISWSGDGKRFVYDTSDRSPPYLVLGSIDKNDHKTITGYPCAHPNWAKCCDKIAYITIGENFQDHIFVYDVEEENSKQLTVSGGNKMHPSWSKDGSKLLFTSDITGNYEIWMIDTDGNETQVTHSEGLDDWADWSWDGNKIVFVSDRAGSRDIWIKELESGKLIQLTTDPGIDNQPNWSPDDRKIAFTSNRAGSLDIWIIKVRAADGTF